MFLVDMRLVDEAIWAIGGLREKPFVIPSLVFECNLGVEAKEGRQEMGRIGRRRAWRGDERGHLGGGKGLRGTVIELDEVLWGEIRIHRDVDDRAGAGNAVVTGARFLNPGAGGVRFTDGGDVAAVERDK